MKNNMKAKKINNIEVFLGGTTAKGTSWREDLIEKLEIDYFNPIVDDWNDDAYKKELRKRKSCDYVLYVISPLMIGVYSIAEVVQDSNNQPEKTLFCVLDSDGKEKQYKTIKWSKEQLKSLEATSKMIKKNGATVFNDLDEISEFLNRSK